VMSVLAVRFGLPEEAFKGDVVNLFAQINGIITRGTEFVHKNGGIIYNFYHDGYDAVFAGEAADAVSAAVTMRHDIMAFNRERLAGGEAPVTLRAAIDRGEVMMGVVGDESRFAPAAVSIYLNSARSLAKLAGRLDAGLLCTVEVAENAGSYSQRYVGKSLKTASRRVYEIFDGDSLEMRTAKEKSRERFAEGVYLLYARDFTGAKRIFMDIVRGSASDGVSRFYLFLADRLEKSGEAEDEETLYLA
ncbi:MAG: hypothetical protein LBJ84_02825, partial [Oscillospiraceae bacterium]|nr:hypothetical protein [Oscillospiraceae bacterium]